MKSAQTKYYTEEDYYNLPETVRAELINGQFDVRSYTFHDKIRVNIYPDLSVDFRELS